MSYNTQMGAARQGVVTKEMEAVAGKEGVAVEKLRDLIARGKVVIPANIKHTSLEPCGIGQGLKTKVNVNLGVSKIGRAHV